jgi:L-ascorbate metabolism protein UlaG (beta-lactamase superfamily)
MERLMAERPGCKRRPRLTKRQSLPERILRVPETARFIRTAAPAFFREVSNDYARPIVPAPLRPHPELWPNQGLHAAWLGHSTVLLKIDGFSILTDPAFSTRIGLSLGPVTLGIKRLVEIALPLSDLPPVDLVLLSHAHMDHFDLPSLRRLENARTQIVTASQTADLLRVRRYARVHELRWNESVQVGPARITAFEVAHWGARMRGDIHRGYNGYLIELDKTRIVFGGDTALTDSFRHLRTARRIDLAIMPVGAYDPWIRVHCNPEQAWQMANEAGAEFVLPVHHQTFRLSRESNLEPVERILEAAGPAPERIALQSIGQEFHL